MRVFSTILGQKVAKIYKNVEKFTVNQQKSNKFSIYCNNFIGLDPIQ